MKTKTVRFVSKEKIASMLANHELVVKREVPGGGKLVVPADDKDRCGLIMGIMSDEILGKEVKLTFSRTYDCWRTGMFAIPDWLLDMSEEVKECQSDDYEKKDDSITSEKQPKNSNSPTAKPWSVPAKKEIKEKNKKNYCVRMWFTYSKDFNVEADDADEAEELASEIFSWDELSKDFNIKNLEYDSTEVLGE